MIIVVSPAHHKDFADSTPMRGSKPRAAGPSLDTLLTRSGPRLGTVFHTQLEIRDYNKLPPKLRQYAKKIHEIGAKARAPPPHRRMHRPPRHPPPPRHRAAAASPLRRATRCRAARRSPPLLFAQVTIVVQEEQLGLGHAVLRASSVERALHAV